MMSSPPPSDAASPQRRLPRRSFRIQSEFGSARQWRSRKNRPCDTCRKRKTACVIKDRPPCKDGTLGFTPQPHGQD